MAFSYKKLVRDKIPEFIESKGNKPQTRILSDDEYIAELLAKLIEEAEEVQAATSKEERVSELADVQEVLMALYKAEDIQCEDVTEAARKKRKDRGAFDEKIYLEDVIE